MQFKIDLSFIHLLQQLREDNPNSPVSTSNVKPVWPNSVHTTSKSGSDVYCEAC